MTPTITNTKMLLLLLLPLCREEPRRRTFLEKEGGKKMIYNGYISNI